MKAIHWINSAGGDFTDGADWSGGAVPGPGNNAVIDASGTYSVTLASAEAVQSLVLNDAGATLSFGDGANLTLGSNLTLKAGTFRFGEGATISGGTLSAKGGKFLWQGGTLNGVTYDGPFNMRHHHSLLNIDGNGLVLTGANGTGAGSVNLGNSSTMEFFGAQTFDKATVNLNDSDLGESDGTLTLGPNLTINQTDGESSFFGFTVVNEGAMNAIAGTGIRLFIVQPEVFTNQGTMTVSNGDTLLMESSSFTNLVSGTLTGGVYEVDAGSTFEFDHLGTFQPVVTDDAVITLSGGGSVIQSQNSTDQEIPIETTLTTIGAAGTLNLLAGRGWSSTNAVTNAGTLVLGGGTFAPSAFTNSGVVSGNGVIGVAIANSGIIEAATGRLDLSQAITGSGTMKIDSGATLEVDGAAASTLRVRFFEGAGTLDLATPSGFAATLDGFAPTDTIDLLNTAADAATLGAGDTLVITDGGSTVATLQLGGVYTGDTFNVASDGNGGTNITVTTPVEAVGRFAQAMSSMAGAPAGHAAHIPDASRLRSPTLAMPRAMLA